MGRIKELEKQLKILKDELQLEIKKKTFDFDKQDLMMSIRNHSIRMVQTQKYQIKIKVFFDDDDEDDSNPPVCIDYYSRDVDAANHLCKQYNHFSNKYELGWTLFVRKVSGQECQDILDFTNKLFELTEQS